MENEPLTKEILRQMGVIHAKLDSFGLALETLARVEERQAATKDTLDRYWAATSENTHAIARLTASITETRREAHGRFEIHALWGVTATMGAACGWLLKVAVSA